MLVRLSKIMNANNKSDKNKYKQSKILWVTKIKYLSAIVAQNNTIQNKQNRSAGKAGENEAEIEVSETSVESIDKQFENNIAKSNTECITKQGVAEDFKARCR